MHPNRCRFPIKPSKAKAQIEHLIPNVFAEFPGQVALVGCAQLRQKVLLEHTFTLLSIMAGIAAISPQVLAHTSRTPNSSQFAERPDPPNRGMPTERRPTGTPGSCAKTAISFTPLAPTHAEWTPNSPQLVERPDPPDRGMPTERKPAGPRDLCAKIAIPSTPHLLIANTGFSGQTLLQQFRQALPNLVRAIDQQQCLLDLKHLSALEASPVKRRIPE